MLCTEDMILCSSWECVKYFFGVHSSSPDVFGRMFGCIVYSDELVPINGKLILFSSNCPPLRRSEIEDYAMLAKVGVHHYNGNNVDLGTACGKYFRVSFLSIVDPSFLVISDPFFDLIPNVLSTMGGITTYTSNLHSTFIAFFFYIMLISLIWCF
ncbi:unnamed protein product [Brassica oleracea]